MKLVKTKNLIENIKKMDIEYMQQADVIECLRDCIERQSTDVEGIVTEAEYAYQRTTKVKPIAVHYETGNEPKYLNYP